MSHSWKTVRVFISSTFRDMHAERDHLVRFVFPELKEKCHKVRVQLIDVDLRWGVTEEDANAGKALDICLDEIDTCRPYFLGLLGFRYGYVPPGHQHSITAQEIYHGVLHTDLPKQVPDLRKIIEGKLEDHALSNEEKNCLIRCYSWDGEKGKYLLRTDVSPDDKEILRSIFQRYSIYQKDRSYFFFRTEALTRQIAGNQPEDFFEKDAQKLMQLKEDIRKAGLSVYEYDDLETFGQWVGNTLWARIEAEAGVPVAEKDWLEAEAEFHELFRADRTRRFVGRRALLDHMHAFSETKDEPSLLLISGEPGSGKSALTSRFAEEVARRHPDCLTLSHFVGASPSSTNLRRTLRYFCAHLNRTLGSAEEVPEDVKELQKFFPEVLAKAAVNRNVLFIIDAVNQFEKVDDAHRMNWLPHQIPANVRFVISSLEGEAQDALLARKPQQEKLHGLSPYEIRELVKTYLLEIRHEFPNRHVEAEFFAKVEQGNPLYILVALEELRVFGKFEELGKRIQQLPDHVSDLFDQVLERIEGDFKESLVRECMSLIACGRHGMTAEELQTLLKKHAPLADPNIEVPKLPDMLWTRLYRSFSAYLFERSGVIDFFHGQLKEAVGKRYLPAKIHQNALHRSIAQYLESRWREPYARALDELPHQLTKAEDWMGVERILCDLNFIEAKCAAGMTYSLVTDYDGALERMADEVRKKVKEFAQFVRSESHILSFYPELTFQQAANQADRTAPAKAANYLIETGLRMQPWLRWISKPQNTSTCVMTLVGHATLVYSSAYSPDGSHIVSASSDETLKIWDAQTGKEVTTLTGHLGGVNSCSYSPDGSRIVSASDDATVKIWDVQAGKELATLTGHTGCVKTCSYSPDGSRIVSASDDATLKIWDSQTGKELATLRGHTDSVNACAYSPDGVHICSGSRDSTLKIWDAQTGKEVATQTGQTDSVLSCAYSRDGSRIVSAFFGGALKIWDAQTGKEVVTLAGHTWPVWSCAFSPDGGRIVSASADKTLKIWDGETGRELATLAGHTDQVNSCAFSPDGKRIVSASWDRTLKIWNGQTGEGPVTPEGHTAFVSSCVYSPDGRCVLSASVDKTLKIWDPQTGKELATLARHTGDVTCCAYSPDGSRIVSASLDNTLILWDRQTGKELANLVGHTDSVTCCAYSPDGSRIVSASWDKTLKIWDGQTGKEVATLAGHTNSISSCAYSPDGKRIVSASFDELESDSYKTLKIWDGQTGKVLVTLAGHTDSVYSCAYSPDGRRIISGSLHGMKSWDAETGKEVASLRGHTGWVNSCAYSSDGKRIVSASRLDKTIKIWDAETGKVLGTYFAGISAVAWNPDGSQLAAGTETGAMLFLKLENFRIGPPLLTAWGHLDKLAFWRKDRRTSFGCPFCRNWSQVPDSALGTDLSCPNCGKHVRLNPFTIDAGWRPVADAWKA